MLTEISFTDLLPFLDVDDVSCLRLVCRVLQRRVDKHVGLRHAWSHLWTLSAEDMVGYVHGISIDDDWIASARYRVVHWPDMNSGISVNRRDRLLHQLPKQSRKI